MKNHNKFLFILIGIAIFSGILCSGIIIASGIQNDSPASARRDSPRREKYPEPHILEKTKLEDFSEISICLNYADVSILPSDGFYLEYSIEISKPGRQMQQTGLRRIRGEISFPGRQDAKPLSYFPGFVS